MERSNEIFRRIQNIDAQWADDILHNSEQIDLIQELDRQRRLKIMMARMIRELPFLTIERI